MELIIGPITELRNPLTSHQWTRAIRPQAMVMAQWNVWLWSIHGRTCPGFRRVLLRSLSFRDPFIPFFALDMFQL
jgi:hypothetical protein